MKIWFWKHNDGHKIFVKVNSNQLLISWGITILRNKNSCTTFLATLGEQICNFFNFKFNQSYCRMLWHIDRAWDLQAVKSEIKSSTQPLPPTLYRLPPPSFRSTVKQMIATKLFPRRISTDSYASLAIDSYWGTYWGNLTAIIFLSLHACFIISVY